MAEVHVLAQISKTTAAYAVLRQTPKSGYSSVMCLEPRILERKCLKSIQTR